MKVTDILCEGTKKTYVFKNHDDYMEAYKFLTKIGVPYSHKQDDNTIIINTSEPHFDHDPSIIEKLNKIKG